MKDIVSKYKLDVFSVQCNGEVKNFIAVKDGSVLSPVLRDLGCRRIVREDWHFDTTLPTEIRKLMKRSGVQYTLCLEEPDEAIYFYGTREGFHKIPLKYLKLFSKENVLVEVDGTEYSYFMTNDFNTLKEKLSEKYGCLPPRKKDWKVNYLLDKNVMDKMASLGATYSITLGSFGSLVNYYQEGNLPYIVFISTLKQKLSEELFTGAISMILKRDDLERLKIFIKSNQKAERLIADKYKPLMLASFHGAKNCIDYLLSLGADVNATNDDGLTALMFACSHGHEYCVKMLLAHGADINAKSKEGWTALVYALANNQQAIAEILSSTTEKIPDEVSAQIRGEKLSFHEKLAFYIHRFISLGDHKTSEIYRNTGGFLSKQTFSKLQSKTSHPSKKNVLLLALGMRLNLRETEDLLESAFHMLESNNEFDRIVKGFIERGEYDIFKINEELYSKTGKSFARCK